MGQWFGIAVRGVQTVQKNMAGANGEEWKRKRRKQDKEQVSQGEGDGDAEEEAPFAGQACATERKNECKQDAFSLQT